MCWTGLKFDPVITQVFGKSAHSRQRIQSAGKSYY
jgi:hypothetical protein